MKTVTKIMIVIVILLFILLIGAGLYFYNYAVVPSKKDFLSNDTPGTGINQSAEEKWFTTKENRTNWTLTSDDELKLHAIYLKADENTNKNVIMAHGYMGTAEAMADYAKMYHDLGYNVLVPDARGHGESEGDYIGFGWPERKDYLLWIDKLIDENGQNAEITLYGLSMGAATVMMTSGESLPENVKAIVEDCGYSSVSDELSYQLKDMFNLPSFPLIQVTSLITKIRAGYFFGEANAVAQLKKNNLPMLFIHGDTDDFVPYEMLQQNYDATNGPKEKYVVHGAGHAEAYKKNPAQYKKVITEFLENYVK